MTLIIMFKFLLVIVFAVSTTAQTPSDFLQYLALHAAPPPAPVAVREAGDPGFSCSGRQRGYYADVGSGCQAYHLCWRQKLVSTEFCSTGTLFNEQFQVCDHFYNVRCGSPYEDL